ncbi:l-ascorbic acid binding [Pelomyxa schiedti]|nr:l-ascorbic acid binding [Pelomyxa schiedti]
MDCVSEVVRLQDVVYGPYTQNWRPLPFKSESPRYLWTDAFGVRNYLSLWNATKEGKFLEQAIVLTREVHNTLGKDRTLSWRLGDATDSCPTSCGLRIGKKDPESSPDGDGQYFHYLCTWMYTLNRLSIATHDDHWNKLAVALGKGVLPHFITPGGLSMYWKLSINLSTPLVWSQGHLDPLDGYVVYRIVDSYSPNHPLMKEINDLRAIVVSQIERWNAGTDPLDLGMSLWLSQLPQPQHHTTTTQTHTVAQSIVDWERDTLQHIAHKSLEALEKLFKQGYFSTSSMKNRLAFREFGTSLGIQVNHLSKSSELWKNRAERIHKSWYHESLLFQRDRDITPVMMASSLLPGVHEMSLQIT